MKPIEYFNSHSDYVRNYEYYHKNFERCFEEYYKLWQNRNLIYKFADAIIDSGLLPIEKLVPKENLRRFFGHLLNISLRLGTNWSYSTFLKALFNNDITIEVVVTYGKVITYRVGSYDLANFYWNLTQETQTIMETSDDNKSILFTEIIQDVSLEKVQTFLSYIKPFQDVVYFEFNND